MIDNRDRDDFWNAWIAEALAGRAADIVYCLAPGLLFADQSRLVIARNPAAVQKPTKASPKAPREHGRPLRYVTPLELSESLTLLGAWGAVFSTPARGSWLSDARMGLRLLVDQLGRLRPGVAAFHDLPADPGCKALAQTYEFMIGDRSTKASTSPSVSLYCHPARAAAVAAESTSMPGELMAQYAKVKELIHTTIALGGPLPTWLAATQRIVEQAVSRAAVDEANGPDDAAVRGLASALKYLEQMIAEQANAVGSKESTSASVQEGGRIGG